MIGKSNVKESSDKGVGMSDEKKHNKNEGNASLDIVSQGDKNKKQKNDVSPRYVQAHPKPNSI